MLSKYKKLKRKVRQTMKNQKIIALILAMAMIMAVAAGCNAGPEDKKTPEDAAQAQTTTVETEAVTEEKTEEATTENNSTKTSTKQNPTTQSKKSATVWKEVPIPYEKRQVSYSMEPFDLEEILLGYDKGMNGEILYKLNTFIFKGTILNMKEYEVSWIDDEIGPIEPRNNAILEVKVNKEYYGKSPVKGDILKVGYPSSLADENFYSAKLVEKGEYIFITWILDDEYIKYAQEVSPSYKGENEKYADVSLSGTYYRLFPVENGKVIMYGEYFAYNENVSKNTLPYDSANSKKLYGPELLKGGYFITLRIEDFENEFLKLIAKTEKEAVKSR